MKRKLLLGFAFALIALLVVSCNKNRFDFDNLNAIEGSGQWKLPIADVDISLQQVLEQVNSHGLINYDADGNMFIGYDFVLNNLIKGSSFLNLRAYEFDADLTIENTLAGSGITIPGGLDTTFYFRQKIELSTDSVSGIDYLIIESGTIGLIPTSNMFTINDWRISSSDITNPLWPGDTLNDEAFHVDLTGARFNLQNDSLVLNYKLRCTVDNSILEQPDLQIHAKLQFKDLKIAELGGRVVVDPVSFDYDTAFYLPINNLSGHMELVGTELNIRHKNTFGDLTASLTLDTVEFYGGNATPSPLFPDGFVPLDLDPTGNEYVGTSYYPQFDISTEHNAFRLRGDAIINPGGESQLIKIYNNSTIGLGFNVKVPFSFANTTVDYLDTFALDLSKVEVTEFIKEIVLNIDFNSKFPFNLNAQLYTMDENGHMGEAILDSELAINKWTPGSPVVPTSTTVTVTQERLDNLIKSKNLILKAALNTGSTSSTINLNNSLGLIIKADVIYGGELDINN